MSEGSLHVIIEENKIQNSKKFHSDPNIAENASELHELHQHELHQHESSLEVEKSASPEPDKRASPSRLSIFFFFFVCLFF